MKKNPVLTFLFACIPGAGQMYYGYMQRGLSMIALFCGCFLLGMLAGPLAITCGIVWMYSFFDTYDLIRYLVAGEPKEDSLLLVGDWSDFKRLIPQHNKLLGWGLIILGVWALYDNFVRPALVSLLRSIGIEDAWYWLDQVPTLVAAVVLVVAGLWLLGLRPAHKPEELPPYPGEEEKR